jgi:hypothetical protein
MHHAVSRNYTFGKSQSHTDSSNIFTQLFCNYQGVFHWNVNWNDEVPGSSVAPIEANIQKTTNVKSEDSPATVFYMSLCHRWIDHYEVSRAALGEEGKERLIQTIRVIRIQFSYVQYGNVRCMNVTRHSRKIQGDHFKTVMYFISYWIKKK